MGLKTCVLSIISRVLLPQTPHETREKRRKTSRLRATQLNCNPLPPHPLSGAKKFDQQILHTHSRGRDAAPGLCPTRRQPANMCPYNRISNISGGIFRKMTELTYSRLRLFNSDCEIIRQHRHEDSEKRQHTKYSRFCLLSCHFNFALNLLLFKVLNTIHMEDTSIPDGKLLIQIIFILKKKS